MNKIRLIAGISSFALAASLTSCRETMPELTDRVFKVAEQQAVLLASQLDSNTTPRTFQADTLVTGKLRWWCSGFFPGTLWYIYEYTGDDAIRDLALRETSKIEALKYRTDDHDIGFQINCSFGNQYRILGDEYCRDVLLTAARSLATRFNPAVGCTKSWNNRRYSFPVIIDNMMNMELLVRAYKFYGEEELLDIAKTHSNTTMKNHFRDDYSTFHLVDYDPETGDVLRKITVQGYEDWSAWSRGQAWALYGYTMMYDLTRERSYLSQAENVAAMLLKRLPADGVPYWDFDAAELLQGKPYSEEAAQALKAAQASENGLDRAWAGEVDGKILRDASAGAIMSSAFIQLSQLTSDKSLAEKSLAMALTQIRTLASDEYLAAPGTNGGFLLKHSVGHYHGNSEVDVPLTYADYYFLEALLRYRALYK